jgi:LPS sulfotransferase NodH
MMSRIKKQAVKLFSKMLSQDALQLSIQDKIKQVSTPVPKLTNLTSPYSGPASSEIQDTSQRDDIVFITSRFRSGSTLLWNLFRQTPSCTSYYEPFNERQWFNPALRGEGVDSTHRGVDDYWREYDNQGSLNALYDEDWIRKQLLMTEQSWAPNMKAYIEQLVENAPTRPVLQFNRVDFRLPWLKQHFPNAKILHLYRHPRDQWCSFLTDSKLMNKDDVQHTYQDAFYLDVWCKNLAPHYPVLDIRHTPHPYQRFYYLWKLSYLHGIKYADQSISFEQLTGQPAQQIQQTFDLLGIDDADITSLCQVIKAPAPERWKQYADDDWFTEHEQICEHNLSLMLGANSKLDTAK